jgi:catechol 2,3-dioxygenase-like lactoylglutathione lyase family enzyme
MNPKFSPGKNIAVKVPPHEFEATVAFYKDVLGLEQIEASATGDFESVVFEFGDKNLWIDRISGLSQGEIWLEVVADDIEHASEYLAKKGCARRDEIEPLPKDFIGFWVSSPANIIHLVTE